MHMLYQIQIKNDGSGTGGRLHHAQDLTRVAEEKTGCQTLQSGFIASLTSKVIAASGRVPHAVLSKGLPKHLRRRRSTSRAPSPTPWTGFAQRHPRQLLQMSPEEMQPVCPVVSVRVECLLYAGVYGICIGLLLFIVSCAWLCLVVVCFSVTVESHLAASRQVRKQPGKNPAVSKRVYARRTQLRKDLDGRTDTQLPWFIK